jgi:hypothetical protein
VGSPPLPAEKEGGSLALEVLAAGCLRGGGDFELGEVDY